MPLNQKSLIINKIILGEIHFEIQGNKYIQKPPTRLTLYNAELVYQEAIEEYKFLGLLSQKETKPILIKYGLWSNDADMILVESEKNIKTACVDLYRAAFDFKKQKDIRRRLQSLRKRVSDLNVKLHHLDYATMESIAMMHRTNHIVANTVFDSAGNLIDPDNYSLITEIVNQINQASLSIDDFKVIARTDPWRSMWSVDRANVFGKSVCDLTEEQRTLITLSKFYDSIYEHPDCPDTSVIEDNDMLDGWLILQEREREESVKKKHADNVLGLTERTKNAMSNDVMVVANSKEEARQINDLNDVNAKMIKAERMGVIKKQGEVEDGQFRDIKLEAIRQMRGNK